MGVVAPKEKRMGDPSNIGRHLETFCGSDERVPGIFAPVIWKAMNWKGRVRRPL
jgi:hypothetical protein